MNFDDIVGLNNNKKKTSKEYKGKTIMNIKMEELLKQAPDTKEKQEALDKSIMVIEKKNSRNERLKAIDYVTTLELIRYFANYGVTYINTRTNLNKLYKLLLEEIELALDDLTLESLLLVISQYKTLNEYIKVFNNYQADERKAKKVLRPINEEIRKNAKVFKKMLKRGKYYE